MLRQVTTRTRAFLPTLVLLASAVLFVGSARAITPVESTPVVTLSEMAKSPVLIEAGDFALDRVFHTATATFPFAVPPGTVPTDPDESWFLLDLSYTIVFGASSASGFAWVSADTNGLTAAQAEYILTRAPDGLEIFESTVTLQDGQDERDLSGLVAHVDYVNYARDEGVVDGRNTFTIRVEHTDVVVIESVEVHDDSGVSQTTVSPDPFRLSATLGSGEIRVGDEFDVLLHAENVSSAELGNAVVEAIPTGEFVQLLDPGALELGSLQGSSEHTFRFKAHGSGPGQIAFLGTSARNEPNALVNFVVLPTTGRSARVLALIGLAAASPLLLGLALLSLRARLRRTRAAAPPG